jgi:hypothetical protein
MTQSEGWGTSTELTTDQIAGLEPPTDATADPGSGQLDQLSAEPGAGVSGTAPTSAADIPRDDDRNLDHQQMQLLGEDEHQAMLEQWRQIQGEFVDEPQRAIHDADVLVADLMQRLARSFAQERDQLEAQLSNGSEVSTEDMRQGLRRYRSFFERLLAA